MAKKNAPCPKVGDQIYVDTFEGKIKGGLARVCKVEQGLVGKERRCSVFIEAAPNFAFDWDILASKQAKLKNRFGSYSAHPDSKLVYVV